LKQPQTRPLAKARILFEVNGGRFYTPQEYTDSGFKKFSAMAIAKPNDRNPDG
jgi:hypothetical protein